MAIVRRMLKVPMPSILGTRDMVEVDVETEERKGVKLNLYLSRAVGEHTIELFSTFGSSRTGRLKEITIGSSDPPSESPCEDLVAPLPLGLI
jgi:hypothetical protein